MFYLEAKVDQGHPRWMLEPGREYVVGRHSECDVVLDDASVSRRHLALTVRGQDVRLQDLGSTNGVWVSGKRIVEGGVSTDQWFAVGTVLMIVREGITFGKEQDDEASVAEPAEDPAPRERTGDTPSPVSQPVSLETAGAPAWVRDLASTVFEASSREELREAAVSWLRGVGRAEAAALVHRAGDTLVVEAAVGRRLPEDLPAAALEGKASRDPRQVTLGNEPALVLSLPPVAERAGWLVLLGPGSAGLAGAAMPVAAGILALAQAPAVHELPTSPVERGSRPMDRGAAGSRDPLLLFSETMRSLVRQVDRLARTDLPVFLHGESGTGKELLARRLHERSARSQGPFVVINCAALPHDLLEAELFGIETGVATGVSAREGKFALASGGTLFLDEVGDLPDGLQPKLLRALESGEIAPLGAPTPFAVDVRIVAASHQDLEAKIRRGEYRRDLLYRLAGAIIRVPPLRERPEEILPMARHFAVELSRSRGVPFEGLSMPAAQAMLGYSWPGNVRELRHAVARSVALSDGPVLGPEVLPEEVDATTDESAGQVFLGLGKPLKRARRDFERLYLEALIDRCGGNLTEASRRAGMSRSSLYRKLEELGLKDGDGP